MSIMNCADALRAVLDEALGRMDNLLVIRVSPDQDTEFSALGRRVTLPYELTGQLGFALGCAQANFLPVLDLCALEDVCLTIRAVAVCMPLPPMIIRAREKSCLDIPGVIVLRPADARQCAGAMRYALQAGRPCLIVENPLLAYETCDVPDDPSEFFMGAPEENPFDMPAPAQDTTPPEIPDAPIAAPERFEIAFRARPYDPAELDRAALALGITSDELAHKCCERACDTAQVVIETDSAPGEVAYLPPEKSAACLWVGRDRLTLCWQTGALSAQEAQALLAATTRLLEQPVRLIL